MRRVTWGIAALALSLPAAALASGPVSFSVTGGPAEDLTLRPGAEVTTIFVVRNPASYSQRIEIEITGLAVAAGSYSFEGAPSPGLTVTAEPSRFRLGAGGDRKVSVTLSAARGISRGTGTAGVIFRGVPKAPPGAAPVIGEIARPLIVGVPGKVTDTGRIAGFSPAAPEAKPGPVTFHIDFRNTGTTHYTPTGTVEVLAGSRSLGRAPVEEKLVLPRTTRRLLAVWNGQTPAGTLRAKLRLRWGLEGQHRGTRTTSLVVLAAGAGPRLAGGDVGWPWWWLVLMIAALVFGWLLLKRRRREDRAHAPPAEASPEEPAPLWSGLRAEDAPVLVATVGHRPRRSR